VNRSEKNEIIWTECDAKGGIYINMFSQNIVEIYGKSHCLLYCSCSTRCLALHRVNRKVFNKRLKPASVTSNNCGQGLVQCSIRLEAWLPYVLSHSTLSSAWYMVRISLHAAVYGLNCGTENMAKIALN